MPANMEIRQAKPEDVDVIRELAGQLGYPATKEQVAHRLARVLQLKDHLVLVACVPGSGVVGWIHLLPRQSLLSGDWAEIGALVIDEAFRGKQIGRSLVREAERWVQTNGFQGIIVRSNVLREGAHEFYTNIGYEFVKTQRVYRKRVAPAAQKSLRAIAKE